MIPLLDRRRLLLAVFLLLVCLPPFIAANPPEPGTPDTLAQQLTALPAQRPGHPDVFVIGVAGDGREQVFANEIEYLRELAATRFDAEGRMIALVNRTNHRPLPGSPPVSAATADNLRRALIGVGQRMERGHDLLLLYMTSHGSQDHRFVLADSKRESFITPPQLRQMLDEAGIERRIVIVSACFSGGFIPDLRDPDTLILTAADYDRSSFGCGASSTFTWFGDALLREGFRRSRSPITAFQYARKAVKQREAELHYPASRPQLEIGENLREPLARWVATLPEIP